MLNSNKALHSYLHLVLKTALEMQCSCSWYSQNIKGSSWQWDSAADPSNWSHATDAIIPQIAKFMGPIWGPPGSCRPQMDPMLAPRTLLSGRSSLYIMGILPVYPLCQQSRFSNMAAGFGVMSLKSKNTVTYEEKHSHTYGPCGPVITVSFNMMFTFYIWDVSVIALMIYRDIYWAKQ